MRANIYIDGFNLYYGALKRTPYKWLDLEALSRILVPTHEIHRIRYFTAKLIARPDDPDAPTRQDVYLRALAANPKIHLHYGRFQVSRKRMAVVNPAAGAAHTIEVYCTEEKGTDVNIATYLLLDALRENCDLTVVVSDDADLAEPIRILLSEFGVRVGIISPRTAKRQAFELTSLGATFYKKVRESALRRSQLPSVVQGKGELLARPPRW